MEVLVKSRVQEFFDINGMDVLSADSIKTVATVNGIEYVYVDAATEYIYRSYFSGLWRDLLSFCPSYDLEGLIFTNLINQ